MQELYFTLVNMPLHSSSMKKTVLNCRKVPFVCIASKIEIYGTKTNYNLFNQLEVDMFYYHHLVESVVLLSNKNAKSKDYVEIGVDDEDYYRIKNNRKS